MASRLGKHLLRAKSKTENFGLFALYLCYFFYLLFGCLMANVCLLLRKQSHSSDVNHCIWTINFQGFLYWWLWGWELAKNSLIPPTWKNHSLLSASILSPTK